MPSRPCRRPPAFGRRVNVGAYDRPFSGVGMEFEPLGAPPAETGVTLHEVGFWPQDRDWFFPDVYSPFWRVYHAFRPGHQVRFGTTVTPLAPDRLLVIPNHQRFDCEGDASVPSLWFAFSCCRRADPGQAMPIQIPLNPILRAFVAEFPVLFRRRQADRRERIRASGLAFIAYVLAQPQVRWQLQMPPAMARVVEAITRDPAHGWRNQVLARLAGMGVDGFVRTFRRWMERTPARYVAEVRIREACRHLVQSDAAIDAIAEDLGFPDRYYFTRVFRKLTGLPPACYRRRHRLEDAIPAG